MQSLVQLLNSHVDRMRDEHTKAMNSAGASVPPPRPRTPESDFLPMHVAKVRAALRRFLAHRDGASCPTATGGSPCASWAPCGICVSIRPVWMALL